MKAIVMTNNSPGETDAAWCFISDSAVSNTGKPFYLPDHLGPTEACLTVALKISRLGKGIDKKFAPRYYQEIAPAIHFRLPEYKQLLMQRGLPADPSFNFDRSLVVGDFLPFSPDFEVELWSNGVKISTFNLDSPGFRVDACIEAVSRLNTLKMGDLLLPGLSEGLLIKEGDLLEVKIGGQRIFPVKVK